MTTTQTEIKYRSAVLNIPRFGVKVRAVSLDRAVYFPVRAMCMVLGLHAPTQKARIKADSRFAEARRDLPIDTAKGYRDALCLRKDKVGEWLALIDPAHCKLAKTRERLEEFQTEVFAAADRFIWGDTGAAPVESPDPVVSHLMSGVLRVSDIACPGCGMRLCLVLDATGAHLQPEPDAEDD